MNIFPAILKYRKIAAATQYFELDTGNYTQQWLFWVCPVDAQLETSAWLHVNLAAVKRTVSLLRHMTVEGTKKVSTCCFKKSHKIENSN